MVPGGGENFCSREKPKRRPNAWLSKWAEKYPASGWGEDIGETLSFYKLPHMHHKHLKSTNMLERMNQEIKRRTHIIRTFPNRESCLRMVRAPAVETHEAWQNETRCLNMDDLKEYKKEAQYMIAMRRA